jgi:S-formylglutathione hydrolase FrmB
MKGRIERHRITSKIMAAAGEVAERRLSVYLPEEYDTSGLFYPVLYLLHGAWEQDRCDDRLFFGEHYNGNNSRYSVHLSADRLFESKEVKPMIIVCPDMNFRPPFADRWLHVRTASDYITQEIVPFIDKQCRAISIRQARAISGHSAGGFGSIFIGLSRPNVFSLVGAIDGWNRKLPWSKNRALFLGHDQRLFPLQFWLLGMKAGNSLAAAAELIKPVLFPLHGIIRSAKGKRSVSRKTLISLD